MRFPFSSNKYFRLITSLIAAVVIVKMLIHPDPNLKMQYFILALAAIICVRGVWLFFKKPAGEEESQ